MSDRVRPEVAAFQELEALVGHLSEELASFRRRALTAESRVRELEAAGGSAPADQAELAELRGRVAELERENGRLRGRLEKAAGRARQMLERVHFLRQQAQGGERAAGGER